MSVEWMMLRFYYETATVRHPGLIREASTDPDLGRSAH